MQFNTIIKSFKMSTVKPKKYLGQHFLKDNNIASNIVQAVKFHQNYNILVEVGPGTGVLTQYLKDLPIELFLIEIDIESLEYLEKKNSKPCC